MADWFYMLRVSLLFLILVALIVYVGPAFAGTLAFGKSPDGRIDVVLTDEKCKASVGAPKEGVFLDRHATWTEAGKKYSGCWGFALGNKDVVAVFWEDKTMTIEHRSTFKWTAGI